MPRARRLVISVRQPGDVRPPDPRRVAGSAGEPVSARNPLRELDTLLFTPGPWLAIDAANAEVRGTRTRTLDQALALVGHGRVASVVGRLRPEVVGVDIDSPVFADEILNTLTTFCRSHGLWHLTRPSGGAPGRAHLFLIPGRHRADLDELVLRLRAELGGKANPTTGRRAAPLGRSHVDVRSQLRPLSAPHRCKPTPALDRDVLAAALTDLDDVLDLLPARPAADCDPAPRRNRRAPAHTTSGTAIPSTSRPARTDSGPHEARTPLPRPRRDLPAGWNAYLRQGRPAAAAAGLDREPGSRSTIELDATRALVLAGLDEAAAWAAISGAHPTAFVKARANGRRWWWHVWNAAVEAADEWLARRRAELTQNPAVPDAGEDGIPNGNGIPNFDPARAEVTRALARAAAELEATWRSWPAQTRHTGREVMRCALERMARRASTSVALPQRDVLQDCAVDSRNTIAARRDDLISAGLLEVTSTHVRGTTDTADTWSLPARFLTATAANEGAPAATAPPVEHEQGRGVGTIEPSRVPPPRPALPLRRALRLPRAHLLEALLTDPGPHRPAELAAAAGLAPSTHDVPTLTKDQQRTVRAHLQALAGLGLAVVDAAGAWTATPSAQHTSTSPSLLSTAPAPVVEPDVLRLHRRGQDRQAAVQAAVAAERTEFRARFDPAVRRHRWLAEREDVRARQAKVDAARRKAWWDGLDHSVQQQRRATAAAAFAVLPAHEQAARKTVLAVRRARAGLLERDRHSAWWSSLSSEEREQRSITRAWSFQTQPEHVRADLVAAWAAHRARWGLPAHPRAESAPLLARTVDQAPGEQSTGHQQGLRLGQLTLA